MVEPPARTLSVLVPAYNERDNLEAAVRDVLTVLAGFADGEVLIVDDGSTDGTAEVADRLALQHPRVRAFHHPRNLGFAAAYTTALAEARMGYFTFVPGDHEVTLDSLERIFGAVGSRDLVIPYHGTPWKRTRFRRALTWICTTQFNVLFGWRLRYYQGPTVYPTLLARALPRRARSFFFAAEMQVHALAAGCSYVEVGLTHQERAYGRSKAVALSNIVEAQKTILRLWWLIRVRKQGIVPEIRERIVGGVAS
jgi:glycosyltransferase involved in cell wall biosynthesis